MDIILDIDRLSPNQYWDMVRDIPAIPHVWGIKARNSAIIRGLQSKLSDRTGVFADFKHSETEGSMRSLGELYKGFGPVWGPDLVSVNTDASVAKVRAMQYVVEGTPTRLALVVVRSDMDPLECTREYGRSPKEQRNHNLIKAKEAGLSAIICPGRLIEPSWAREFKVVIATGVRSEGAPTDEHQNPITPREACARGATHWVVGREVTLASDPLKALRELAQKAGSFTPTRASA